MSRGIKESERLIESYDRELATTRLKIEAQKNYLDGWDLEYLKIREERYVELKNDVQAKLRKLNQEIIEWQDLKRLFREIN
jgi:hypothetical protein